MKREFKLVGVSLLVASIFAVSDLRAVEPKSAARKMTPQAWTLREAQGQLGLNPHDSYLQYVALQLGKQQNRQNNVVQQINAFRRKNRRRGRRDQADLFKVFSGALAVQESLQLDTMTGNGARQRWLGKAVHSTQTERTIDVSRLQGPTVKSHPWKTMLAGCEPQVSPLALCVPEDQYFVVFRSLNKLLDVLDLNDHWGAHVIIQTNREARKHGVSERLKTQLAVKTDPLTRPFYDLVVEEVAATGSDLYVREGSDVTLLFRFKQPVIFQRRMDGFLSSFAKTTPGARRTAGEYMGVKYVHLTAPDRRVHVFSAYPRPGLHVRSNSWVG